MKASASSAKPLDSALDSNPRMRVNARSSSRERTFLVLDLTLPSSGRTGRCSRTETAAMAPERSGSQLEDAGSSFRILFARPGADTGRPPRGCPDATSESGPAIMSAAVAPALRRTTRVISSGPQPESSAPAMSLCNTEPSRRATSSRPRARPIPSASASTRDCSCVASPRPSQPACAAAQIRPSAISSVPAAPRQPRAP